MPTALQIVKKFFPGVRTVEDARADVDIEVTTKDSSSAAVKNHKACAMAVACKRAQKVDGVIISINTAYLIKGSEAIRYKLPEHVSREVVSFDRKGGFAAGEYTMLKPRGEQRLGKQLSRNGKGHGGASKFGPHKQTEGIRTVLGSKMAAG
jgi:hypothetical protein